MQKLYTISNPKCFFWDFLGHKKLHLVDSKESRHMSLIFFARSHFGPIAPVTS